MNERDEKVIKAMIAYDNSPIGSQERITNAIALEKVGANLKERDMARIGCEYARRKDKDNEKG